ncbi:N-6 DNA methylase [Lysinibacillus capsici]|uniref:Eco57I restriction-modification methylase domain-containing protein n=1 Tax=Lysinibacillus capsici TaxID=2115968 RepID=UPI002E1A11DC|nr:N-6 DNA methylase [Lysinibacillus capsici]
METKKLINILESGYSTENFIQLSKAIFKNNIDYINEVYEIINEDKDYKYIKSYKHLMNYTNDTDTIAIIEINLQKNSMVKRSRTAQRNFIAQILKDTGLTAALVSFYSEDYLQEWRLSFVKFEYILNEEGKFIQEITIPKRSSFLVGAFEPSHTAKKQLLNLISCNEVSLNIIEEAFGIEKVTKEFFEKYKEKYLELNDILQKNSDFMNIATDKGFTSQEFSKKLLGQIVFLYFLQKKGWLGVPALPDIISIDEYQDIIENLENEKYRLLFSRLFIKSHDQYLYNKEIAISIDIKELNDLVIQFRGTKYFKNFGYGDKAFLRNIFTKLGNNENYFEDYLEPLLYEALNEQRGSTNYYARFNSRIPFLNGGLFEAIENYDWKNLNFNIPNEFFVDKKGQGLFDIFDLFNFTVNESEPLEQEIAIDPEMLGKIFENLLEINNRKDSGSYYTPREIVHFMCQDSIVQYVTNHLGIEPEKMKTFIQIGDLIENKFYRTQIDEEIYTKAKEIDEHLSKMKIVDPAVGSGAFALGMLTQIVKIRSNLTYIMSQTLTETEHPSFFAERSIYNLKLASMQDNIFAVDLDYSAVDITKLRLWLSLIVDNEIDTVNPLPNLDCNIKVGNSLIDEYMGLKLFDRKKFRRSTNINKSELETKTISGKIQLNLFEEESIDNLITSLNELQKKLFRTHDKASKDLIKMRIEELEWAMLEYMITTQSHKKNVEEEFQKLRKSRSKPFFLWERDFSEIFDFNQGFDIVIGNPPYGAKLSKDDKKTISKWMIDTNNMNTAALFIDFSKNHLLRKDGVLAFIVPKSLLYSEKWFSLVETLSKKTVNLIDVEKAFEKVKLEQVVFLYNSGQKNRKNYIAQKFLNNEIKNTTIIETKLIEKFNAWICDVTDKDLEIAKNLNSKIIPLSKISTTKRGVGIQKLLQENGDIPVIGGRNIDRFTQLGIRGYVSVNDFANNSSKLDFMKNVKIMSQDLIGHIQNPVPHIKIKSCIDRTGMVLNLDTVQNTIIHDKNFTEEYIVSLLNSEFINWYTYKFIYCSAIRTMHFDNNYIGKIKIPSISIREQQPFVQYVKEIESLQSPIDGSISDVERYSELMKHINDLIFDLYGITEQDKKFIMAQFA